VHLHLIGTLGYRLGQRAPPPSTVERQRIVTRRRVGRILPVLILTLGLIGWQAGIGFAGPTDASVDEPTTTTGPAAEAPAADTQGDVAALAGPVGYTNGVAFRGPVPDDQCVLYAVDLPTGAMTAKGGVQPCIDGLTFSPDGTLYAYRVPNITGAVAAATLVRVDVSNGAQVVVGTLPALVSGGMTFDGAGNLWLYAGAFGGDCAFDFCLFKVDPTNAHTTFVGGQDTDFVGALAATCTEVQAATATAAFGSPPLKLQRVDTATAGLTAIVAIQDVGFVTGLDYDAGGGLWGLGAPPQSGFGFGITFSLNSTTGQAVTAPLTLGGDPFPAPVFGLAVAGLSCAAPAVLVTPSFTG
jgi:hypothetical protein